MGLSTQAPVERQSGVPAMLEKKQLGQSPPSPPGPRQALLPPQVTQAEQRRPLPWSEDSGILVEEGEMQPTPATGGVLAPPRVLSQP